MTTQSMIAFLLFLSCFVVLTDSRLSSVEEKKSSKGKVKVFVLAGQSNMEGHGEVASKDDDGHLKNGTLLYQVKDPRTKDEFSVLWDESKNDWVTLSNVKVWFNEAGKDSQGVNGSTIPGINGKDYSSGDLTVGYGTLGPQNPSFFIGPELGFGFNVDRSDNEKVLIVKTAWGGKSLSHDFRPPSSAGSLDRFCLLPECNPFVVGHFYKVMVEDVRRIMKPGVVSQIFPDLAGFTPEISGFGWFQGWNDGCSVNDTAAYERNMVNIIKDLRREWNNPTLPISIAVSGFGGYQTNDFNRTPPDCWDGPNATKVNCSCGEQDHQCRRIDIILSQFAAANISRHPEIGCCVEAIETRGFYREPEYSPNQGQGYHFFHNAETHYLVGKAIALGMNRATSAQKNWQWKSTLVEDTRPRLETAKH